MKVIHCAQGSVDWSVARSGIPTASELDALVTTLGKVRTGDMPRTYLHKKITEAWLGGPLASLNVWDVTQGEILEEYAKPAFTLETGLELEQVGFITDDAGRVGCSPDGIVTDKNWGVEIKSPRVETHVGYLLNGIVPPDYVVQVQASLYVTGFEKWYFFSFCRRMPPLILEVYPDKAMQTAIGEALAGFLERFDEGMAKLVALNGGAKPKARDKFAPQPQKQETVGDSLN